MTVNAELNLDGLSDKAFAWFANEARRFNGMTRGPDLQWFSEPDGTFEVRTTEALTPGRLSSCANVLQHSDDAEQSFWFCPDVFKFTQDIHELGEDYLLETAKLIRDSVFNDGPMDRSAVFLRRWADTTMLVISSGRETYLVQVPDRHVLEFIKMSLREESNVIYLFTFPNTV